MASMSSPYCVLFFVLIAQVFSQQRPSSSVRNLECGPCQRETCRTPPDTECVAGYVTGRCGCCQVCGRREFELCDVTPDEDKFGICGDNLRCRKVNKENVCVCRETQTVCGSDRTTFPTICSLNEEATRRGKPDKYNPPLSMHYWGPCKEAPVILSPPQESYGPLGANLTLDCEARGYPAPTITWQFINTEGKTISLPNDDQSVSIQMRGGPEPLMVTSWAQIMSLDPSYIGIYHCIASNSEGKVYARASVGVYKNEL